MVTISRIIFALASLALILMAFGLVIFGVVELFGAVAASPHQAGDALLTAIGYGVIALAVFDVAKYFIEEEVIADTRGASVADTRRSLTKFVSTIAIAVFIEGLVLTFQVSKRALQDMIYPTGLLLTGVLIVFVLAVYQRLSVAAERDLHPAPRVQPERPD